MANWKTWLIKIVAVVLLGVVAVVGVVIALRFYYPGWVNLLFGLIGSIVALICVGVIFSSFKSVPQDERWVVELFGAYSCTLGAGLRWICPFIEKVRARVSTRVRPIQLFTDRQASFDFVDGSAKPRDAFVFVQMNEVADPRAAQKVAYVTSEIDTSIAMAVESVLRSYFNGLTVDEALPKGRGGHDILQRIKEAAADDAVTSVQLIDFDGINALFTDWGMKLIRITIGDFDLDESVVEARESVISAKRAKEVAGMQADTRSAQNDEPQLRRVMNLLGITREEAQKRIRRDPALRTRLLENAQTTLEDHIASESKGNGLFRSRGDGVMGTIALAGRVFGGIGGNNLPSAPPVTTSPSFTPPFPPPSSDKKEMTIEDVEAFWDEKEAEKKSKDK